MADVQVNLAFTADTSKAKAQLQDLQNSLKKLTSSQNLSNQNFTLTKDLQGAVTKAHELEAALKLATNVNTGRLDLGQFNKILQDGKTSLSAYGDALRQLGPEGKEAFAKLTTSIMQTEIPLKRTSKLLTELKTTLVNTAKWQLSSSIIHGFMGAVQQAYGYAQDLNRSLNDIRIVTGYGVDRMSQFAAEANKAAQALSTSTTAYTDASLIYYQQGLNDQEVKERTDITIKMANVARESAVTVSDQMTAVWNNFADGSKTLEYYADVMTELGAATAASTSEIAEGLEKFAAISKTVGLSYEYATAALTTVVDRTRQSADVVGTAFKTMFARIEGLKLGETLEDGTTLNEYSEALMKVGVNIKDSNGELKDMNDILDEMGAKWQTLNRDEQVALAQKVAGVRQYQQLISLMENYDFFKENVSLAEGSSGTLSAQADIYADSWEAAQKRVKAAAESVYSSLLNDDFFIEITNGVAEALQAIEGLIKGLGGVKGVLSLLGSVALRVFGEDIARGLNNMTYNLKLATKGGLAEIKAIRQEAVDKTKEIYSDGSSTGDVRGEVYTRQAEAQNLVLEKIELLASKGKELTDLDQQKLQKMMDQVAAAGDLQIKYSEEASVLENQVSSHMDILELVVRTSQMKKESKQYYEDEIKHTTRLVASYEALGSLASNFSKTILKTDDKGLNHIKTTLIAISKELEKAGLLDTKLKDSIDKLENTSGMENLRKALSNILNQIKEMGPDSALALEKLETLLVKDGAAAQSVEPHIEALNKLLEKFGFKVAQVGQQSAQGEAGFERLIKTLGDADAKTATWSDGLVATSSAIMSVGMAVSTLQGLGSIWKDEDASLGEKMLNTFTSLAMALPMVTSAFSASQRAKMKEGLLDLGLIAGKKKLAQSNLENAESMAVDAGATEVDAATKGGDTVATGTLTVAQALLNIVTNAYFIAIVAIIAVLGIFIALIVKASRAQNAEVIAAQNAAKAAQQLKEKYNECKQEYEDMIATMENYKSARDALSELTAGTEEYREALSKANDAALELIGNNPEKFKRGEDYNWENGQLIISDEAMSRVKKEEQAEVAQARAASTMASAKAQEYQARADASKATQKIVDKAGYSDAALGALAGASDGGAAYRSAAARNNEIRSDVDQAIRLGKEDPSLFKDTDALIEKLGLNSETDAQLIKAIRDNIESLEKATAAEENANELRRLGADQAAAEGLANNEDVIKSSSSDEIIGAAGRGYDKAYQDAYEKWESAAKSRSGLFGTLGNDKSKEAFQQYVDEMGLKGAKATNYMANGNIKYKYLDDEGKEQNATLTPQDIAAVLAERDAQNSLGENAKVLKTLFDNLKNPSKEEDSSKAAANKGLADFLADDNINTSTKKQLDALKGLSKEDIEGTISAEQLKALGYETYDALYEALQKSINKADLFATTNENGEIIEPKILQNLSESIKKDFQNLIDLEVFEDLTGDQAARIADTYQKVFKESGKGGVDLLNEMFSDSNVDAGELASTLSSIDWQTTDLESLKKVLDLTGVSTEGLDDRLQSLINTMQKGGEPSQTEAMSTYKDLHEISDDLDAGEKISVEDMQKLTEANPALKEFFSITSDGMYRLTGDAQDFKNAVEQIAMDKLEAAAYADEREAELKQSASEMDWGELSTHQGADYATAQLDYLEATGGMEDKRIAELRNNPEVLANAYQEIMEAVAEVGDQTQTLVAEAEAAAERAEETRSAMDDAKTYDQLEKSGVDLEEYEQLGKILQKTALQSKQLSNALSENESAAKKIAAAVLRYDKALESVQKNSKDWEKSLKSKSLQDRVKVTNDLKQAYSDMLDLDMDSLSDSFATNADNLKLMEQAANGSQAAYDQLRKNAMEDIIQNVFVNDDNAQKKALELNSTLQNELQDMEIGATIDDKNIYQQMNELINAADMTAQEASDLLASMGIDAEVEEVEVPKEQEQSFISAKPNITYEDVNIPTILQSEDGATVDNKQVKVPKINYEPIVDSESAESQETVTALRVKSARKSSGGDFKFHNSNHGAGSGGSKGKNSCFTAGTPVSAATGFIPIEKIRVGDVVLSYNENARRNEYSKVLQTMIHIVNEDIYDLYIGDEILHVTGIHRFLASQNDLVDWVAAADLSIGDEVLFADHTWHMVKNIKVNKKFTVVYNFEVSGNHNYYVGKNRILAHNKGGGGGGKSNPAKTEKLTKKSDIVPRYKQIEDKLKTVNKNLDKYNSLSELAFGKNKVKAMDQIINAYKEQIKLQQQLIQEAQTYAKEDKSALTAAATDLGVAGLKFDSSGNVSNIETVLGQAFDKLHKIEEPINSFATSDDQSKYKEEKIDPYKDKIEAFKEALEQYEESLDKAAEAEQAKLELEINLMNARLEKANFKIKLRIEFRQTEIENFERELAKLENRAFSTSKRMKLLNAELTAYRSIIAQSEKGTKNALKTGIYKEGATKTGKRQKTDENGNPIYDKKGNPVYEKYQYTEETTTFDDWMKANGYSKDRRNQVYENLMNGKAPKGWDSLEAFFDEWNLTEDTAAALKDFKEGVLEAGDALLELKETVDSQMIDTFNHWAEIMERNMTFMEHWIDVTQTWDEIIDLLGHKNVYGYDASSTIPNISVNKDSKAPFPFNLNIEPSFKAATAMNNTRTEHWETQKNGVAGNYQIYQTQHDEYKAAIPGYHAIVKENREEIEKLQKENEKRIKTRDAEVESLKKKANEEINKLKVDLQNATTKKEKEAIRAQIQDLRTKRDNIGKDYDDLIAATNKEIKSLEDEIETAKQGLYDMKQSVHESREELLSSLLELLEKAKENVQQYIADLQTNYEAWISGVYGSVEGMQEALDKNKEISERYVGDYEKVYQLTKLNRDLEKQMDETSNLKAKQKLSEYQEKILKYSKEGVKMSQYDLDILQKEYDLEVAKIALEEAQNAKSQVRLTRDAEGNYSYTYTADESKRAEAEQSYEDKLNELINFNNDYATKMEEQRLTIEKQLQDTLVNLAEMWDKGELTQEECLEKAQQASAYYSGQMAYYARENEKATMNNATLWITEYDAYYGTTKNKIAVSRQFTDEEVANQKKVDEVFENAQIERDKSFAKLEEDYKNGRITTEEYFVGMKKYNEDYTKDIAQTVELENGERKSASDYFVKMMERNVSENDASLGKIMDGNAGLILNTQREFLPGLSDNWTYATQIVQGHVNLLTDGKDDSNKTLLGAINQGMVGYENQVGESLEAIGVTLEEGEDPFEKYGEVAGKNFDLAAEKSDELLTTLEQNGADAKADMDIAVQDVKTWYEESKPWWNKAYKKVTKITTAIDDLMAAASDLEPIKVEADTTEAETKIKALKKQLKALNNQKDTGGNGEDNGGNGGNNGGNDGAGNGGKKKKIKVGDTVTLKSSARYANDSWGNGMVSKASRDKWAGAGNVKVTIMSGSSNKVSGGTWTGEVGEYYVLIKSSSGTNLGWVRPSDLVLPDGYSFDTGGYTGKWGTDGRWALLHQKELILNERDTENMLAAVKTVRQIAEMIDLQAQNSSLAGQYALAIGSVQSRAAQQLDQNVHITAEFPNVQDHNEVELAITSLVNRASQFAWRQ